MMKQLSILLFLILSGCCSEEAMKRVGAEPSVHRGTPPSHYHRSHGGLYYIGLPMPMMADQPGRIQAR